MRYTGHTGVYESKHGLFTAVVSIMGWRIDLGYYGKLEDAVKARKEALGFKDKLMTELQDRAIHKLERKFGPQFKVTKRYKSRWDGHETAGDS